MSGTGAPEPTEAQRAEATRLIAFTGDAQRAFDLVERQLGILVLRTQVLLSLSGIVITVTGFSGSAIARAGPPGAALIVAGLAIVLASATVAMAGVLRVTWLSQRIAQDPLETIANGMALRDRKASYLKVAMFLFLGGFALYVGAIANLLLRA